MPVKRTKKKTAVKKTKEELLGKVEHIFDKIHVITTTLKNPLKVGDIIRIKGHTTDFCQSVDSIQIEHESVLKAKKGDGIGIKTTNVVRDTDIIYLADKKTAESFRRPQMAVGSSQLARLSAGQAVGRQAVSVHPILPSFSPRPMQQQTPQIRKEIQPQMPQRPAQPAPKKDTGPRFMSF